MKKFVVNLITLLEIVAIVGINSFTTIVYADELILDAKTSEDNVLFSAKINDSNDAQANVDDGAKLNLYLAIANAGYLKDIKVTLNDSNYQVNANEEPDEKGSLYEVTDGSEKSSNNTVKEEVTKTSSEENKTSASENKASTDLSTVVENVSDSKNEALQEKAESLNSNQTNSAKVSSENGTTVSTSINSVNGGSDTVATAKTTEETISPNSDSEATTETSNLIKSISDNVIELNEVTAGNSERISIPLIFRKLDQVSASEYSKTSKIDFEATYVNEKGKEKKIKKSTDQKLTWNVNQEEEISQKLVRYLKYDSNTLVSFEISDGIKDNKIPAVSKEIKITAPKISGQAPARVIVTGNNVKYSYENGIVTINKEESKNENEEYAFDSKDTYMVTYIYNAQDTSDSKTINEVANAKVTTIKGDTIEKTTDSNDFTVNGEVGSIVEVNIEKPETLNKGYLYTNLNRDDKLKTTFNETYKVNVGLADLTDKININEKAYTYKNADNNDVKNANVKTSKVSVSTDDLTKVLGDNGTIIVKNGEGKELGTLNKGLSELTIDDENLSFEISKPQIEGNIEINLEKYLASPDETNYDEIKSFAKMQSDVEISSTKSNAKITDKSVNEEIKLEDPTSKATMYVSTDTLSTVVENKDIVFNVVLNTNDISDALYKNPAVKITLPKEVTNIKVTEAEVFYDDEIKAGSFNAEGNVLTINLQGLETKYNTSAASTGAMIRIVANVSLDNLAPSSDGDISLEYSNEFTGENNKVEGKINVVAPSGFVTTNTISIDGKDETALEEDVKNIEINIDETSRKATVSGKIVNNLGGDAEGAVLVGRIPYEGNKNESGDDLASTISTRMSSPITTDIPGAKVYYSENIDESVNGSSWSEEYTNSAKSYKIVAGDTIKDKTVTNFSYEVALPQDLDYEKQASETYGVYYKNNSTNGEEYNLVQAKTATFATEKKPDVTLDVSAQDYNEGYAIDNEGKVTQGEKIIYKVKATNNGSNTIENAVLKTNLSKNVESQKNEEKLDYDEFGNLAEQSGDEFTADIGELKPGESKVTEVIVKITGNLEGRITLKELGLDMDDNAIISDEDFQKALASGKVVTTEFTLTGDGMKESKKNYTVREVKGNVTLGMTSSVEKFKKDQEIQLIFDLDNANEYEKNDVEFKMALPKELKFVGDTSKFSYDESTNTVTRKFDLDQYNTNRNFIVSVKVVDDSKNSIDVVGTATYNGTTVKSNTVTLMAQGSGTKITAEQTTNIPNGKILDTDEVEYYIYLKNDADLESTIKLTDEIPSQLKVEKILLKVNDDEKEESATNHLNDILNLPAKSTARYTIIAKGISQENGTKVDIENAPIITPYEGGSVTINSIKLSMQGTQSATTESIISESESSSNSSASKSTKSNTSSNDTRSIFGTVWFDKNNNGVKDNNEDKIEGIKISLLDNSTKQIANDSNGKELVTTTNSNGEYELANVAKGSYVIIAEYDNQKYEVGQYSAQNSTSAENSNFVQTKLNSKNVASSNIVNIEDANIYNENLALISKKAFNLSLDTNITKVSIVNAKDSKRNKEYSFNSNLAKVELDTPNVDSTTVLVEYKIKVTNIGEVAGYANKIVDYLPAGMVFNSDLNKDWYVKADGNAYTAKLSNTLIEPGETKEVKIILTKKITGENVGTIRNTAEIAETYNELGISDIDSTVMNKKDGENDMSSADVVILMNAGRTRTAVFGISLGIIAIISYVVFKVKKNYIDKIDYSNK